MTNENYENELAFMKKFSTRAMKRDFRMGICSIINDEEKKDIVTDYFTDHEIYSGCVKRIMLEEYGENYQDMDIEHYISSLEDDITHVDVVKDKLHEDLTEEALRMYIVTERYLWDVLYTDNNYPLALHVILFMNKIHTLIDRKDEADV